MTRQTKTLLLYCAAHLRADPTAKGRLRKLFKRRTGRPFTKLTLFRHFGLRHQPPADCALVYLSFLNAEGLLAPAPDPAELFVLTRPELLTFSKR